MRDFHGPKPAAVPAAPAVPAVPVPVPVPVPAAPAALGASTLLRPSTYFHIRKPEVDATHSKFKIGDTVIVDGTLKDYAEFRGATGAIVRIVAGHNFFFCVRLDCPQLAAGVARINAQSANTIRWRWLRPDESDLLCVKVGNITKLAVPVLGKRKAAAGGA